MKYAKFTLAAALLAGNATAMIAAPISAAICTVSIPSTINTSAFGQLQLPVDQNGDGKPDTISGSALQSYSSTYMERKPGTLIFRVPTDRLVHTSNSRYPRSELKENQTWTYNKGCAGLAAKVSIYDLPSTGSVVIGQVHQKRNDGQAPRPPLELYYDNGSIHADVMKSQTSASGSPRTKLSIVNRIGDHSAFTYSITVATGGLITVTVNGTSKTIQLDPSFSSANLYFKAGNYTQDENGGSSVGFLGLAVQHK